MGRPKGVGNKATKAREEYIHSQGVTPLAYMLRVLRDESQPHEERKWAAQAAAPYVHPKLAQMQHQHSGMDGKPIESKITVEFVGKKGDAGG